jgi:hypothetical protein
MKLTDAPTYAKAIAGALTAFAAALTPALADGNVTSIEWLTILAAVLAGFGVVYTVPNATADDTQDGQE